MISEKYLVDGDSGHMADARHAAERFAEEAGLDQHGALRLRLLAEETLGMVKAMMDDFYGQIWFVRREGACEIHLQATAEMDADRKHELLSVSRSGKNAAVHGFMGMIGEVISNALYDFGRAADAYGAETIRYGIVHSPSMGAMPDSDMMPIWSLQAYRANLAEQKRSDESAAQAWDELEKSVVASLADDVTVGVKGDRIELVIVKADQ